MRTFMKEIFPVIAILILTISIASSTNNHTISTPPTEIYSYVEFDEETGLTTIHAWITPSHPSLWIEKIYYWIDEGEKNNYTEAFKFPEGTHLLEYEIIANEWLMGGHGSKELTYDSTPPICNIITPDNGLFYLGNRLLSIKGITFCIGNVSIEAEADDGDGYGVKGVYFTIKNESGYDSAPPYTFIYSGKHFGKIIISVIAEDNRGFMSEPIEKEILLISLGIYPV